MPSKKPSPKKRAEAAVKSPTTSAPAESKAAADDKGEATGTEGDSEQADQDDQDADSDVSFGGVSARSNADLEEGYGGATAGYFRMVAGGGGGFVPELMVPEHPLDPSQGMEDPSKAANAILKFTSKLRVYEIDSPTDTGIYLENLTGEGQSKFDPLPEEAHLLADTLRGMADLTDLAASLTPSFLKNLSDLGYNTERILAATEAVKMIIAVRDGFDKGRLLAITKQLKQLGGQRNASGSGSDGGGAADTNFDSADTQLGEATIYVKFQKIDRDSHNDSSKHPPTVNTPDNKELLKQALLATHHGKPAKAADFINTFARANGTQGVAPHILFSVRSAISDAIAAGAYGFSGPGDADSGGLTVQVSAPTAPTTVGFTPLSSNFDRTQHFAAEAKLMDGIKSGQVPLMGSTRNRSGISVTLTGPSHRNHQSRALLQERAAHIFCEVALHITYSENLMASAVKELVRVYLLALKNPHEAESVSLATATEFNTKLTAEALVLAKASIPFANIGSNFLAEYTALVTDQVGIKPFLAAIANILQAKVKPGESAQALHGRLERLRQEAKEIPEPKMNFAAIGLSCEDNGQLTVLSTPKVVILLTVEHMFVTVPKALPHNRVREVVTQDILEQAMRGELTVPALNAIFGKLIELRIDTVIPMQGDEGKQQHPVGAFAAAKSTSFAPSVSAGKPGHGQGSSQFAQERGRHQERRGGGSGRQRSRSQDTTTVEVYKKSIDFIVKNGPIKFLQNLHDTCKSSLGATLFEHDHKGAINTPLKLCKAIVSVTVLVTPAWVMTCSRLLC